jgi:hypothetical protein
VNCLAGVELQVVVGEQTAAVADYAPYMPLRGKSTTTLQGRELSPQENCIVEAIQRGRRRLPEKTLPFCWFFGGNLLRPPTSRRLCNSPGYRPANQQPEGGAALLLTAPKSLAATNHATLLGTASSNNVEFQGAKMPAALRLFTTDLGIGKRR